MCASRRRRSSTLPDRMAKCSVRLNEGMNLRTADRRQELLMPRPPEPPDREDFPVHELEDLDKMLGRFRGQMPGGYFGVLANSPPLGWRLASTGRAARQRGNFEG